MSSEQELPPDAPSPRLCHLVKWADFEGYGFNLHAEKSRSGQFIGKVDAGSPAELAGLREGDRIVEVNGVNIAQENHRQVVERIKAHPQETRLLVLDARADQWYRERKIVVRGTQANVEHRKTPTPRPKENGSEHDGNRQSNGSAAAVVEDIRPKESAEEQEEEEEQPVQPVVAPPLPPEESPDSPHSTRSSRSNHSGGSNHNGHHSSLEEGVLNLNMSASEMRQMLANRRRKDPKKEPMDIRQKYEIIQQM